MVNLLRKIFIKNYQNVGDDHVRTAHGSLAAWFGIVSNLILVGLKLFAAFYLYYQSNWTVLSIALIADAANNFVDMASSIITLIGFKVASKKPDREHPFGHQRAEYIAALIVALLILVVGVELLRESITKVAEQIPVDYSLTTVIILGVAVLLKLLQSYVNFGIGKCISSLVLRATAIDSLLDAIATTLVLLAALFAISPLGWNFLDGWVGIFLSLFILYEGAMVAKDALSPLLGERNDPDLEEKIKKIAFSHKEILGIHDLIIHSYGATRNYVSFHAEVDESQSLLSAHNLIDEIEKEIKHELRVEVLIHIDPVAIGDEEFEAFKEKVVQLATNVDQNATIHDFRIIQKDDYRTLSFDVLLPYEDEGKEKAIAESVIHHFKEIDPKFHFDIDFDHPF